MSVLDELFGDVPNNNTTTSKKQPSSNAVNNNSSLTPGASSSLSSNTSPLTSSNMNPKHQYGNNHHHRHHAKLQNTSFDYSPQVQSQQQQQNRNTNNRDDEPEQVQERFFLQQKSSSAITSSSSMMMSEKQKRIENRKRILSQLSTSPAFPSTHIRKQQQQQSQRGKKKSSQNNNNRLDTESIIAIPPPSQVWQWIAQQGRFAEALNVLDTLATLRRADWEEREMDRCRYFEGEDDDDHEDSDEENEEEYPENDQEETKNSNTNKKSQKRRSHDDLLEESIEHRDKMRLLRAETLALHAATTFAVDFPNVALQPFLSEHHCEKARKQIVASLKSKLLASSSSVVAASSSSSFFLEKLQSWSMLVEEDRTLLRQELSIAVEALEALCVTQAHSIQELILVSAMIQLNRAVFYLCASILPISDSSSSKNKSSQESLSGGDDDDDDKDEENENEEEDEEELKSLDHTLLAASLLMKRPSWQSLASFNRKTLVMKKKIKMPEDSNNAEQDQNIIKIAASVQRCMKLCQKFKTGGKLSDARVLISTSVMLAELQSALDVALPEALKNTNVNNSQSQNDRSHSDNHSNKTSMPILSSSEYAALCEKRNVSVLKCEISGAPIKMQQQQQDTKYGDEAIRIFVPTTTTNTSSSASTSENQQEKENNSNNSTTTTISYRFDRAKKEKTSKRDVEMIVDRDVWLFFEHHCVQK